MEQQAAGANTRNCAPRRTALDSLDRDFVEGFKKRKNAFLDKGVQYNNDLAALGSRNPPKFTGVPAMFFGLVIDPLGNVGMAGSPEFSDVEKLLPAAQMFCTQVQALNTLQRSKAEHAVQHGEVQPPAASVSQPRRRAKSIHEENQSRLAAFYNAELKPQVEQAVQEAITLAWEGIHSSGTVLWGTDQVATCV